MTKLNILMNILIHTMTIKTRKKGSVYLNNITNVTGEAGNYPNSPYKTVITLDTFASKCY